MIRVSQMTSSLKLLLVGLCAISLSACSNGRVSIGGKPDEYRVVARSGLVMPEPGSGLARPLPPGSAVKDAEASRDLARTAILGETRTEVSPSILEQNFGQYSDSSIRQSIDYQAYQDQSTRPTGGPLQGMLRGIQRNQQTTGTPIDLEKEQELLSKKGVSMNVEDFAALNHSLELLRLGEQKFFDPAVLLGR